MLMLGCRILAGFAEGTVTGARAFRSSHEVLSMADEFPFSLNGPISPVYGFVCIGGFARNRRLSDGAGDGVMFIKFINHSDGLIPS